MSLRTFDDVTNLFHPTSVSG